MNQNFKPPYVTLFKIIINISDFANLPKDENELDTVRAITVHKENLPMLNEMIKFIQDYDI